LYMIIILLYLKLLQIIPTRLSKI